MVGFALTLDSAARPGLWMTGDTVMHGGLRTAAAHLRPDVMLAHIGLVKFPRTGPLTYTMDAADAVELIDLAEPASGRPRARRGLESLHPAGGSREGRVRGCARPTCATAFGGYALGTAAELPD